MNETDFDNEIDLTAEIRAMLDFNEFSYKYQNGVFSLNFEENGFRWKTVLTNKGETAHIYGIYPHRADDTVVTFEEINEINCSLAHGCLYIYKKSVILHSSLRLNDAYYAYESLGRALEDNAAEMYDNRGKVMGLSR